VRGTKPEKIGWEGGRGLDDIGLAENPPQKAKIA